MSSTTFTDYITPINASWLNDVDAVTYEKISAFTKVDSEYSTLSAAVAAAETSKQPLLATPTLDAAVAGAYTKRGFFLGHSVIGNGMTELNAFCGLQGDEYYTNVGQEVRGISYVVRNTRTVADEATLGWDFFGGQFAVVVEAGNTQYIRGNQKAVVGELYFKAPNTGSYSVRQTHNFQAASMEVGTNVTVETWYGLVVNNPTGAGTVNTGYGIYIEALSKPGTNAAIKMAGQGNAGQIAWPNTSIKEDVSGKLEFNLNNLQLVLTNALVATTATAGASGALPATVQGYWRVLIGGIERKIPYYAT